MISDSALQTINIVINLVTVIGLLLLHIALDRRRRQIVGRLDNILNYTRQIPQVKEKVKEIALDQKTNGTNPGATTPKDTGGS